MRARQCCHWPTPARRLPGCMPSRTSRSSSMPARPTRSWARTERASRRWSRSWPACTSPTPGCSPSTARRVFLTGPGDAADQGIAVIYQEPTLFPDLSVAENVFIGRQPLRTGRRIDARAMDREVEEIFKRLGVPIDPDRIARGLSIAEQQLVEIAKALDPQGTRPDHGRADRRPLAGRGQAAVRGGRDAARRRGRRRLHLPPPRGGLRDLPAGHRAARRQAHLHQAARGPHAR